MKKTYSRSIVTFGTEIVSTPSDLRATREEVRSAPLAENVEQHGDGVGYQQVGKDNQIG